MKESKMTQAATIDPTSGLTTPEVDISKIRVTEGYNPRKLKDPEALQALADSIADIGIIEPLVVSPPDEDGFFDLKDGERRLEAATIAGERKVPITVSTGGTEVTDAGNYHREGLDPVAQARSWKAMAEEHNLTTHKAIAEKAKVKRVGTVSAHLRLLDLPEGVQRYFEERFLSLDAEPQLRELCKASPRAAECVCELAKRKKLKPSHFVSQFGELLAVVPSTRFDDPPVMVPVASTTLALAVADPGDREHLAARLRTLYPGDAYAERGSFRFSDEEIDAARAARCLIEYRPRKGTIGRTLRYITDREFAGDLAERAITRIEGEVTESRRRQEERERQEKARRQGTDPDADEIKQAEERKEQLAERKQRKANALASNEEVGRLYLQKKGGRALKQRALVRFRIFAHMWVDAYPDVAARGLRIVLPQLREVETTQTKTAGPRQKITYVDRGEARQYLHDQIDKARSLEEGTEILTLAAAAALVADEDALTNAEKVGSSGIGFEAAKALEADVRIVTPRAVAAK
jgi:ParB/RepB/Spo0J family partition protein